MLLLIMVFFVSFSFGMRVESQECFQPKSLMLLSLSQVSTNPELIERLPEELKIAARFLAKKKGNIHKALLNAVFVRACCWSDLKGIEKRTAQIIPGLVTPVIKEHVLSSLTFFGILPLLKGGANVHVESKQGQSLMEIAHEREDEPLKRLLLEHNKDGTPIKFRNWNM